MKYIVIYYTESNYIKHLRKHQKEFMTFTQVRNFLIENVNTIKKYLIYRLTDLTNK